MTATLPFPRALPKYFFTRSSRAFTRPQTTSLLRVSCNCTAINSHSSSYKDRVLLYAASRHLRNYATAAEKKAQAAPKARATSSNKKTKAPKAAKKPKKKVIKPVVKKVKKPLSKNAQYLNERIARASLRNAALLTEPKALPATAWQVLIVETSPKGSQNNLTNTAKIFKTLAPEERERLNQEASSNKAKNDAAYKQWLATHDPLAIKKANKARQTLRKQAKNPKRTSRYAPIKDDRLVKEPRTAWIYFLISRQASGDFKGLTLSETSKLISKEWHTLPANEKERYEQQAQEDKNRYLEESKSVYHLDS